VIGLANPTGSHETFNPMKKAKLAGLFAVLILIIASALYGVFRWYPFVFSKTVTGEIVGVERVSQPQAIVASGGAIPASQIFSFAIAVKTPQGEIFTASSEDRQWAVAQKGQCSEVKLFPYAPWDLEKAGTYYGARLLKLFDCSLQ
jgi:hypothetical protein